MPLILKDAWNAMVRYHMAIDCGPNFAAIVVLLGSATKDGDKNLSACFAGDELKRELTYARDIPWKPRSKQVKKLHLHQFANGF